MCTKWYRRGPEWMTTHPLIRHELVLFLRGQVDNPLCSTNGDGSNLRSFRFAALNQPSSLSSRNACICSRLRCSPFFMLIVNPQDLLPPSFRLIRRWKPMAPSGSSGIGRDCEQEMGIELGIVKAKRPRASSLRPSIRIMIWWEEMVGARGFEPPASWTRTRRSTKLSHAPRIPLYPVACAQCKVAV